jgi:lactoylglutathione lyase
MKIGFSYTILYVADVTNSIEFYENAFGFTRKFIDPTGTYGELMIGPTVLSFAKHELVINNITSEYIRSDIRQKPLGFEIGFTTEHVPEVMNSALKFGAELVVDVTQKPWGQIVAYVRDLDGFLIEICTPMD